MAIRNHESHRRRIDPVDPVVSRPLWSVMIPTYNCATYLRQTLQTVLAQDPGPDKMQIEVIDDCSTADDPETVAGELGKGRVTFYRQPQNVGHVANFNTCLSRARGQLVHLLHGDDCVRHDFYEKMQNIFMDRADLGAAFCSTMFINERSEAYYILKVENSQGGILESWLETIAMKQRLTPPSIVVRREVYEKVGGFDDRIRHYGEDWEMWVRIAAHYPVWYLVEPLAFYRTHDKSLSRRTLKTGENMQDLRRVIEINWTSLPAARATQLSGRARKYVASAAIKQSRRMIVSGDTRGAAAQILGALRFSWAPDTLGKAIVIALMLLWRAHLCRYRRT